MSPLILKTCEEFVRLGYDVELWVPQRRNAFDGDPFEKHRIQLNFPIRKIWALDLMAQLGSIGFFMMVFSFNLAVWWRLRGLNENVLLYGHDLRDFVLPSILGLPICVEIHDFYESRWHVLNRFVLHRVAGLIVTNSIKKKRLAEYYGFPEKRMIVQPNAVDVPMFDIPQTQPEAREILHLPLEQRIVLYTGHLFSWKGVHTLAEVTPFLPEDTCVYFVGGTESDRASIEQFVAERSLPRIVFLPHQEHARIPLFLRAADVIVLPNTAKERASKYETSPVKLFEYLASGTPIVTSDLPSIREIVTEKEVIFAEPDNPESFARAIQTILESSAHGARKESAQTLARTHTWEARAEAIKRLLESVA